MSWKVKNWNSKYWMTALLRLQKITSDIKVKYRWVFLPSGIFYNNIPCLYVGYLC